MQIPTIRLEGIECQVKIGVPDEERAVPQRIVLDVELVPANANSYVDYFVAYENVRRLAAEKDYRLVEDLGEAVLWDMLGRFPVERALVRVHKWPAVMPGVEVVAELKRSR